MIIDKEKLEQYEYLGDAVGICVVDGGWHLLLFTEDGNNNLIYLEPAVEERLLRYLQKRVRKND